MSYQQSSCNLLIHSLSYSLNNIDGSYSWCLLNDLLVSSLHTAIPLKKIYIIAMLIPKHLNFNVPTAHYTLVLQIAVFLENHICSYECYKLFLFNHKTNRNKDDQKLFIYENPPNKFILLVPSIQIINWPVTPSVSGFTIKICCLMNKNIKYKYKVFKWIYTHLARCWL